MSEDLLSGEARAALARRIQQYLSDELEVEIGGFDAQFLLDFVAAEVGAAFYNRGLQDARALLERRLEDVSAEIDALERPTGARR